ncbi:GNAT family N-acetyltransferase [Nocardiopsis salina]|uniref:GNAT family N-acetyltransferase n=1 Tax=Nocardiopsis salina TaxID=245836 RepID=UPI000345449D|nr:GNAT family protein [Nocardiopsis salina]
MSEDTPWIWLRGDVAGLGPIRDDLLETYWRLDQQISTIVGYNRQSPQPLRTTRAILIDGGSSDEPRFTIYDLTQAAPVPVGVAKLAMDTARSNAEYIVSMDPEHHGRGIGTEATRLVLDWAFHVANMACVWLTVLEPNAGAIRAYEKAGFSRQGIRRDSSMWLGQRVNEVYMDAVPAEFPGPSMVKQKFQ